MSDSEASYSVSGDDTVSSSDSDTDSQAEEQGSEPDTDRANTSNTPSTSAAAAAAGKRKGKGSGGQEAAKGKQQRGSKGANQAAGNSKRAKRAAGSAAQEQPVVLTDTDSVGSDLAAIEQQQLQEALAASRKEMNAAGPSNGGAAEAGPSGRTTAAAGAANGGAGPSGTRNTTTTATAAVGPTTKPASKGKGGGKGAKSRGPTLNATEADIMHAYEQLSGSQGVVNYDSLANAMERLGEEVHEDLIVRMLQWAAGVDDVPGGEDPDTRVLPVLTFDVFQTLIARLIGTD